MSSDPVHCSLTASTIQVLQTVSVDVSTHSHLDVCLALRISEAVALLNSQPENDSERVMYSASDIERALLLHRMGKKCKQRFLRGNCKEAYISKSRRGYGGNAVSLKCMAIAQERIPSHVVQQFRDGEGSTKLPL